MKGPEARGRGGLDQRSPNSGAHQFWIPRRLYVDNLGGSAKGGKDTP